MWKITYTVAFVTREGNWIEMPRCESPVVVAELVRILASYNDVDGEVIKVTRWKEGVPA